MPDAVRTPPTRRQETERGTHERATSRDGRSLQRRIAPAENVHNLHQAGALFVDRVGQAPPARRVGAVMQARRKRTTDRPGEIVVDSAMIRPALAH
ncbi:hypothetical protein [Streptomyces sp. T028]|uniref:hypothetical protein n=1 Tax=Streptomyces sp. T028 TaxID=3394379 RepID=UPI003A869EC1